MSATHRPEAHDAVVMRRLARYFRYVQHQWRYASPLQRILHMLNVAGIGIQPFYVFLEGLPERLDPLLEKGYEDFTVRFLELGDLPLLLAMPDRNIPERLLRGWFESGKLCLGVKYRGELAAFTWCDLEECNFRGFRFPLREDEAYLFDAHTSFRYRGKGLAPFVRYRCYQVLAAMGRTRLYSVSIRWNYPSLQFKAKLHGRVIGSGIYCELFRRWGWTFIPRRQRASFDVVGPAPGSLNRP